jgi:hypothetical protein
MKAERALQPMHVRPKNWADTRFALSISVMAHSQTSVLPERVADQCRERM